MNTFDLPIEDLQLTRELQELVESLGGMSYLADPGVTFTPYKIEIRRSPIEDRLSVTILGYGKRYLDGDFVTCIIKFKWNPEERSLYCVIPWHAIFRPQRRAEAEIRELVAMGRNPEGDPDLNRLLLEEAEIVLSSMAKTWPDWAQALSQELDIRLLAFRA